MNRLHREEAFAVRVPRAETARLLGYGKKTPPRRVRALIEEAEKESAQLLRPAFAFLRLSGRALSDSPFLGRIDAAAICLVTIGERLEAAVEAHDQHGDLSRALVLNAYGSAAAEAAAEAANARIREVMTGRGLRCSRRFSPGYGGWSVEEQKWIIPALHGEALGVTLTDGCMMFPKKSITFAVTVGTEPVEMREDNACDDCDLIDCRYRRVQGERTEKGVLWATSTGSQLTSCPRDRWS